MVKEIMIGEEKVLKANSCLAKEITHKTEWQYHSHRLETISVLLPKWAQKQDVIGIRENKESKWCRIEKDWKSLQNVKVIKE